SASPPAPSSGSRSDTATRSPPCSPCSPTARTPSTSGTFTCSRTWPPTSASRSPPPPTSTSPRPSAAGWRPCTCWRWPPPEPPTPVERTHYFRRVLESGVTLTEETPSDLRAARPFRGWQVGGDRVPQHVVWVPLLQDGRVVGALSAQRHDDRPFAAPEVELL